MADKKRSVSRKVPGPRQSGDEERNSELLSRDTSVRSQDDSPESSDQQMAAGSSSVNVVNSQGPVQLGTGATVISNQTNHNYQRQHQHNHTRYHYNLSPIIISDYLQQQAAALGSSPTPCPVSQQPTEIQRQDHKEEDTTDISDQSQRERETSSGHQDSSLHMHRRDHQPIAKVSSQNSETRPSGLLHHPVSQQTSHEESTSTTGNNTDREPVTTVTRTTTPDRTELIYQRKTSQLPSGLLDSNQRVTSRCTNRTSALYREEVDSRGRFLEPGDVVWFNKDGGQKFGTYVGHLQVVWSDSENNCLVVKEDLAGDFGKCRVYSGRCRVFPREERVQRAVSLLGTEFTDGVELWYRSDFISWVCSRERWDQATESGFTLSW